MNREDQAAALLPKRPNDGNKGTFGKALLFAGSVDCAGAAVFAAEGAYRAGAGLVKLVSPEENRFIIQTAVPEALLFSYLKDRLDLQMIKEQFLWCDSVLIGPGLSKSRTAKELLSLVKELEEMPVVYDADALNLLAMDGELPKTDAPKVFTPHIGEMSRLIKRSASEIKADRVAITKDYAEKTGAVVACKDHVTVVAAPGEEPWVWEGNNSGLSTGGSGDILAGILTWLLAGKMKAFDAAKLAVMLHGLAGEEAASRCGKTAMMARDILASLPLVLKKLEDIQEK
jgi:NAD(P)H-hydrate epimerase